MIRTWQKINTLRVNIYLRLGLSIVVFATIAAGIFFWHDDRGQFVPQTLAASEPVYPIDLPDKQILRDSPKKVFGFYFPPFPISVDNKDPSIDIWEKWYSPLGNELVDPTEDLRDMPQFRRPVRPESNWRQLDFEVEVRQAIAAGLDGFIYEHNSTSSDNRWKQLGAMLAAAQAVDPDFKIMISPDFPTSSDDPSIVANGILPYKNHPSLYKDSNGNVVLAPFFPERKPVTYWNDVRSILAQNGMPASLLPIFLGSWAGGTVWTPYGTSDLMEWNPHIIGYSTWGTATESNTSTYAPAAAESHRRGKLWMSPVTLEDVRHTKTNGAKYYEPNNSSTLRSGYEQAIAGDADIVYLRTWNDYAEAYMAPSQRRGTTVLDVGTYYLTWLKTGQKPAITRDALYFFHRSQRTDAPYDTSLYTTGGGSLTPIALGGGGPSLNQVELLAFLTAPGRLVIQQGSDVRTMDAPAGVTSFKVDMVPGTTPVFKLERSSQTVLNLTSNTPIRTQVKYQDFINHAGGIVASRSPAANTADLNTDGKVDVYDLTMLLGKWNTTDSTADISKDGTVNVFDLSILLSKWTG